MKNAIRLASLLLLAPGISHAADGGRYKFDVEFQAQEYTGTQLPVGGDKKTGGEAKQYDATKAKGADNAAAPAPASATAIAPTPASAPAGWASLETPKENVPTEGSVSPSGQIVTFPRNSVFYKKDVGGGENILIRLDPRMAPDCGHLARVECPKFDKLYVVPAAREPQLDYASHLVLGMDHGILVVPFKFRTHDQSISSQSTIGYYIGLQSEDSYLGQFQIATTTLISVGLTQLDVTNTATGTASKESGATLALGSIYETQSGFQFGWILGWDFLGDSTVSWEYQGSPWVSIGIGFGMADRKGKL